MKNRSIVYLILGIAQIVVGFLGSYFVFVVSGAFMLFRCVSVLSEHPNKGLKVVIGIFFMLINLYFIYYSSLTFISELNYASLRPAAWIAIPIAVTLIVFIAMLIFEKDAAFSDGSDSSEVAKKAVESSVEDLTLFAVIFVGWIGTFVFEFYFEYAAALCLAVCALNNICGYLFTTNQPTHIKALSSEEEDISETEETEKEQEDV